MRCLVLSARVGAGGTRRYALELAPALAARGHVVALAAPDLGGPTVPGVDVLAMRDASWREAHRVVRAFQPDVVRLITGAFPPDTRWGVRMWAARVPVVESLHVLPRRTTVGPMRSTFYRVRGRTRYRCVVLSPGMEREVRRLCPAIEGALVGMRYGMVVPSAGRRDRKAGEGIRFITVTRLEEKQKAVGVLLDAFAMVRARSAGAAPTVTIVGDGPDRAMLEEKSAALGLGDAVRFEGWAPDAIERMRDADVFVLSTRHESFGRVNVEAAAVGLPVIATDDSGGGCRESVADGVNGVLVRPEDSDDLAGAMRRMCADEDWRTRLEDAGPAHAARFGIGAHAEAMERVMEEVTRDRGR